ncbi:MAG: LPXTG cell wall anchor domain-containing protein [Bacteroidales bacterium]|nr:LPXTG cell wall anchor domain-containing protein [Bacteroidales bacterium]
MKKTALTFALVLAMGIGTFAQESEGGMLKRSKEYQATYRNDGRQQLVDRDGSFITLPGFGQTDDQDGALPLGSGIAVLLGLGAAYMVGKKRKED